MPLPRRVSSVLTGLALLAAPIVIAAPAQAAATDPDRTARTWARRAAVSP